VKWVLISILLWGDGAYTITSMRAFDDAGACVNAQPPQSARAEKGQPTAYSTSMCVPESAWNAFLGKWPKR
jgi:hypothetical protein